MVQNASWEWLLRGFKIDLETRLKPRTVKDYCDHVSYFARWVQGNNKRDPRSVTKRDIQEFLHFVASTPAIFVTGNRAKRQVQRDENSRWHHYFPLKRFFAWAVNEGYLEQNPTDGIVLKPPKPQKQPVLLKQEEITNAPKMIKGWLADDAGMRAIYPITPEMARKSVPVEEHPFDNSGYVIMEHRETRLRWVRQIY